MAAFDIAIEFDAGVIFDFEGVGGSSRMGATIPATFPIQYPSIFKPPQPESPIDAPPEYPPTRTPAAVQLRGAVTTPAPTLRGRGTVGMSEADEVMLLALLDDE